MKRRLALVSSVVVMLVALGGCAGGQTAEDAEPTESSTAESDRTSEPGDASEQQAEPGSDTGQEGDATSGGEATEQSNSKQSGGGLFGGGDDMSSVVDKVDPSQPNQAIQAFEKFTGDDEQGYLAHYNIGVMQEIKGESSAAIQSYKESLSKNPGFTPALENLAMVHLRRGDASEASAIVQEYIDERPDDIDHRTVQLEIMLYKGQYQDAVRRAKSLLRRDETNVRAMLGLARANYWMERSELAKAVLERAIEIDDGRPEAYYLFGLIAMENEEDAKARANFEKAVELNPRFAAARNNLGLLYHIATDYDAAREQFEKATDFLPTFKEAYLNLGNAYKGLKEYQKAKDAFERALEIDGSYADAYFNLGILYMDSDIGDQDKIPRLQEAIEYLNEYKRVAKQIGSDDPVDDYLAEAKEKIKVERQRQEMMRQNQKGGGGGGGNQSGESTGGDQQTGNESGGSAN